MSDQNFCKKFWQMRKLHYKVINSGVPDIGVKGESLYIKFKENGGINNEEVKRNEEE